MQISRKLHKQRHMNQTIDNGKQLPLQQQQHQSQRCTMKSNVILIFIVLFFIAATTLLQLPTLNYINYLTNSSNESQIVKIKPFIPSYKMTKGNENIDDDNDDGNDEEKEEDENENDDTANKDSEINSNEEDEAGNEDTYEEKVEHHDVELVEEPDDGGDVDHGTKIVESENEQKTTNHDDDTEEGEEEAREDDDKGGKGEKAKTTKASSGNAIIPPDDTTDDQVVDDKDQDDDDEDDDDDESEPQWEKDLTPKIVWLASYPNSGTSYTMTLVERASNLSTATNYGNEVTHPKYDSIPIYPNHEEGPFWEGTSEHAIRLNRVIRNLPTTYILTKTHCGGRCIKCPVSEYLVNTTRQFIYGCQKTSYRKNSRMVTTENGAPMSAIKKVLHLIRNPYHNVVARFHLERKNMIAKDSSYEQSFTYDATGFQNYCDYLDTTFNFEDKTLLPSKLYKKYFHPKSDNFIPCAAEFYKWVQWHNYVVQSSVLLGLKSDRTEQVDIETDQDGSKTKEQQPSVPVHVIWYENYELDFNTTFLGIMDFLQLPIATEQIRTFRALPTYDDHFTTEQRTNVQALIQKIAIPSTWKLIQHYFE